ncbi:MAG: folylpolyglutamate synthase/dihydrofolate synthase family protein [Bacteroidota bacterium]
MTYPETLDYLFTQLPMYQRQGAAAMKKDLTNIRALLAALGNPHEDLRCIHVAGTNGKGTVCHLLAAALRAHGYRVGMYTSPHYKDFRERIKVDGAFIPETEVIDFVAWLREAELDVSPSFFEITVALAFLYFAREQPDWCVIEVGLGGRLDSTNVITPLLSVITNIGLDHVQFLGDTLGAIAGEKGGIIKPGVPVVVGETHPETEPVFRRLAGQQGAEIVFADAEFPLEAFGVRGGDSRMHLRPPNWPQRTEAAIKTNLQGPFVVKNHQTAFAALTQLERAGHLQLSRERLLEGWADAGALTYFIGRWQLLSGNPLVIADSAHNAPGLAPVIRRLEERTRSGKGRLHVVLGMVNDKDLATILPLFPRLGIYYFVKADIPRGLPAAELRKAAQVHGLMGDTYGSVRAGLDAALAAYRYGDVVFVGGSIFTVAEVL